MLECALAVRLRPDRRRIETEGGLTSCRHVRVPRDSRGRRRDFEDLRIHDCRWLSRRRRLFRREARGLAGSYPRSEQSSLPRLGRRCARRRRRVRDTAPSRRRRSDRPLLHFRMRARPTSRRDPRVRVSRGPRCGYEPCRRNVAAAVASRQSGPRRRERKEGQEKLPQSHGTCFDYQRCCGCGSARC